MGRWDNSDRASRLPSDWPKRRLACLRACNYRCVKCGAEATDVDHIQNGDDHSPENLQALCRTCHDIKTRAEGAEANRRKQAELRRLTRRKPEPTPGQVPRHLAKPLKNRGW